MNILYLPHQSIDILKWDETIAKASTKLPYAQSWYLDIVTDTKWDALVAGDYDLVFPLPFKRKYHLFGPKQYLQPLFNQQLGLFAGKPVPQNAIATFLSAIPAHFQLNLHEGTAIDGISTGFFIKERMNYVLDLSNNYEQIRQNYSKSLRKRIRRARPLHELKKNVTSPVQLITIYRQMLGQKVDLKSRHYKKIHRLMNYALVNGYGEIWTAYPESGQVGATGFFLIYQDSIFNLFGASTSLGYEKNSMHCLLDHVIETYAGQGIRVLDFEGSSIPSVAQFFASFGSEKRLYWQVSK